MKVAVIGSREITNQEWVIEKLEAFLNTIPGGMESATVLVGGAAGVQDIVKQHCDSIGVDAVLFKPWHLVDTRMEFTPRFFFMRNKQIIDNSHKVFVLTNSTPDSEVDRAVTYASNHGKEVISVTFDEVQMELAL